MSVNTNGSTIYAHESLPLENIINIIENDDSLKARMNYYQWNVTRPLIEYLQEYGKLIRTRGIDKEKQKARLHKLVICECGCQLVQQNLYRHRQSPKHLKLMGDMVGDGR